MVEGEIVRGDPALRRRMLLLIPLVLLIAVVALATAPRATRLLVLWLQQSPETSQHAVLAMIGFAAPFTLISYLVGVDAVRRSMRTIRARRFPPPGMRVVRDTRVLQGKMARAFGMAGLSLGVALLTAGTMLPVLAYRIGIVLRDGCPRAAANEVISPDVLD